MKKFYVELPIFFILLIILSLKAQWKWQNPIPFGDPIRKVFFIDSLHGWMAPKNTTLLRTIDGGKNWDIVHTNILFNDVFFIDHLEGWGIGRTYFENNRNSIYHTTDGGLSWEIQIADTTVRYDIYFINRKIGWAVGDGPYFGTLLHTKDGGLTWERKVEYDFLQGGEMYGVNFLDSLKGWVVGGFFYSIYTEDGGNTWHRDSSLAKIKKLIYTDSLHLFGISDYYYMKRSSDGGESWEQVSISDTLAEVRARDIFALDSLHLFIATNIGIYASSDGGRTWSYYSDHEMNSFHFLNEQEAWGGGISGLKVGLFHSLDGGKTWENKITINNPYGFESYTSVDFVNTQIGWIIGTTKPKQDSKDFIIKTIDEGNTWQEQAVNTSIGLRNIQMLDEQYGWIVGNRGKVIYTTNGGENWHVKATGYNMSLFDLCFIDRNHGWVVGGGFDNNTVKGLILQTLNGGETWYNRTPDSIPRLFGVSFVDSLNGWVVGGGGSTWDWGIIMRTRNGGLSWETLREGYGLELEAVSFVDTTHGWVIGYDPETQSKIIHTNDGGKTWHGQLKSAGCTQDIIFINRQKGWVVSLYGRIYHTNDGGNIWQQQPSYTSQCLHGIDFVDDSTGWVVGWYGTILHTTNGGITSIKQEKPFNGITRTFILHHNYPNPFNPKTTISFSLPESGPVELTIYNIQGKVIKRLISSYKDAGNYSVDWDGKNASGIDVSSGLYIYQLRVKGIILNKKMLLIR